MIQIQRTPAPSQLTAELVEQLTAQYKESKENVWNRSFIKKALLEMSCNKCIYCECKLDEEAKYMEVEHFYYKNKYLDKVIDWSNLLPSCKRCNMSKSKHDVGEEPIINPTIDNPAEHLYFSLYMLRGKSDLGNSTVDVLDLNDRDRLVKARFDLGQTLQESLMRLYEYALDYEKVHPNTRKKNRLLGWIKGILQEGTPEEEYSAIISTILFHDELYEPIKAVLERLDLWDEELETLEEQCKVTKLDFK